MPRRRSVNGQSARIDEVQADSGREIRGGFFSSPLSHCQLERYNFAATSGIRRHRLGTMLCFRSTTDEAAWVNGPVHAGRSLRE